MIYSSSIQYNEIIEGLSLGRNIRFNPRLLMVSKRGGEGKDKNDQKDYLETHLKRKMLTGCLSFQFLSYSLIPTYPVPCCWPMEKLGQENQFDKLSITVTCPSPLSAAYQFIIQTFCLLASQRDFGGQSLNTQLTVIGIKLRCRDERLENTI